MARCFDVLGPGAIAAMAEMYFPEPWGESENPRERFLASIQALSVSEASQLLSLGTSEFCRTWCTWLTLRTGRASWVPLLWGLSAQSLQDIMRKFGLTYRVNDTKSGLVGALVSFAAEGADRRNKLMTAIGNALGDRSRRVHGPRPDLGRPGIGGEDGAVVAGGGGRDLERRGGGGGGVRMGVRMDLVRAMLFNFATPQRLSCTAIRNLIFSLGFAPPDSRAYKNHLDALSAVMVDRIPPKELAELLLAGGERLMQRAVALALEDRAKLAIRVNSTRLLVQLSRDPRMDKTRFVDRVVEQLRNAPLRQGLQWLPLEGDALILEIGKLVRHDIQRLRSLEAQLSIRNLDELEALAGLLGARLPVRSSRNWRATITMLLRFAAGQQPTGPQ